ncbi:hypothetical protein BRARA_C03592 [Brassica rapa]|uniref:Uncharacterized protein n=1 Tax=Brassica campestris TaxID=3711 RepID=A0A398A1H6_BRACM|nr:hypothetical protein BRARA_C03592 [Brassica rapa]
MVAIKAAIEANPRFLYNIQSARPTCNKTIHGSCMYQLKLPILSASTVMKFIISPLVRPCFEWHESVRPFSYIIATKEDLILIPTFCSLKNQCL